MYKNQQIEIENKAKEKLKLENEKKKLNDMAELYSTEKIAERKKLCNVLQSQIQDKRNEKRRVIEADREQYIKMMNLMKSMPSNTCPHSKPYKCTNCKKTFPRKYLSKYPLNNFN